jgi:hypothetical protein
MTRFALIASALLTLTGTLRAGPSTQPHGQWHEVEYGQLMLRDFKNSPYPHPSRAKGFTNRAGESFGPEHYTDSTVGIVIPKTFKPTGSVDLVVHFHGHRNYVENVIDHHRLAEQLVASGCNAILIVPQGPKDAPDSGFGKMEDAGGFEALMREIVEYLHEEKKIPTTKIGHIAITAHSGGYNAVSAIVARGGLRDNITDVILFDATYGGLERYADWIKLAGDRRLLSIFTAHLAPENFELLALLKQRDVPYEITMEKDLTPELLAKRTAIFIHTEDLAHDEVVMKRDYFSMFLMASSLAKGG